MKTSDALVKTLKWRQEVADGEMVESRNYTRTHLGFERISQVELDIICATVNFFYALMSATLRVENRMGEIVPTAIEATKTNTEDLASFCDEWPGKVHRQVAAELRRLAEVERELKTLRQDTNIFSPAAQAASAEFARLSAERKPLP